MSKIAVITGGASGLGEATARRFAAAGWAVEIGDRDALRGQAVASELGGVYSPLDVASEGSVNAFAVFGALTARLRSRALSIIAPR